MTMAGQPTPTVTAVDVERIVRRDFPADHTAEVLAAKLDYRDVLGPAEYPGYGRRMFRIGKLPLDEQQRIIDADWKQYQDWLTR